MSEVKVLHLLNGEDIVAEVKDVTPLSVTISNPARIIVMPPQRPGEGASVGLAPWLQFTEAKDVVLNQSHIMYQAPAVKELLTNYQQMFSKIITPASLIVPR